jgi:hypothetical protein
VSGAPWRVREVRVLPEFRLRVRFNDGTEGTVDMSRFLHGPDAGVFAPLAKPDRFAAACVESGVVTWPGELDLAPDAMHAEIRAHGEWVL